jgi:uncharacterized protein (TIGR03435 family)
MTRVSGIGFCIFSFLLAGLFCQCRAEAQTAFAVATIRPSAAAVEFERDGKTEVLPDMLRMHDVTLKTCIKWAFRIQSSQIVGPDWIESERYDILAKTDVPVTDTQMKLMTQTLLAERFKLKFHRQPKELKGFTMTVAKSGAKLHSASTDGRSDIANSAMATSAKSTTMAELANFISGPLEVPVVDDTGLAGKYDFEIDFTNYVPHDDATTPGVVSVMKAALQGELGLKLEPKDVVVEALVIDHVERPSPN